VPHTSLKAKLLRNLGANASGQGITVLVCLDLSNSPPPLQLSHAP